VKRLSTKPEKRYVGASRTRVSIHGFAQGSNEPLRSFSCGVRLVIASATDELEK
jgi:hypothetical protein